MRLLVTGVAGFIGSSTAERLLADGRHQVIGIDSMRENYDIAMKMANLNSLRRFPRFEYVPGDLRTLDLRSLFDAADAVYHLAAVAGVRDSWADNFAVYLTNNVQATQQVLEAALATGVPKVVYASSSSAYGNAARYPVTLDTMTRPQSPYGVTKLAGEHLCSLYASNHGVNAVSLRYFTVYGPRQRPDMAIHRMIEGTCLAGDSRGV